MNLSTRVRVQQGLMLLCLVLAGILLVGVLAPDDSRADDEIEVMPDRSIPAVEARVWPEHYQKLEQCALFGAPPPPPKPEVVEEEKPPEPPEPPKVVALFGGLETSYAVLKFGDEKKRLAEGDSHGGFKLTKVILNAVVLLREQDQKRIVVELFKGLGGADSEDSSSS